MKPPRDPHQGDEGSRQDTLGFQRCLGGRHLARAAKGDHSFAQSQRRDSREVGVRIQRAQVPGGFSERDFPGQEDCCEAFPGAAPAGLPRRGPGAVSARSCGWMRFTCGRSCGHSCGRGCRGSGGGAVDGVLITQDAVGEPRPSGVRRQREKQREKPRTRERERDRERNVGNYR